MYRVVSFYTIDTPYEKHAKERLIPSLEKFKIKHDVLGIHSRGDWRRNIWEKTSIINTALGWPGDVVWLDADAEVCKRPKLFETGCDGADFAFHLRHGKRLSSGTMFFRNVHKTRKLVAHWLNVMLRGEGIWERKTEQEALQELLPLHDSLKIVDLPLSYSTIFDKVQPKEPVVIRHHQASRLERDKKSS